MSSLYRLISLFTAILLVTYSGHVRAESTELKAELAEYVAIFKGDNFPQQRRVMDKLIWAGYSTPELFDVVAESLVRVQSSKSKADTEKAAWLAKTLALSGNEKYRPVLESAANNAKSKKVRKHAQLALDRIAIYSQWNPVISAGLEYSPMGRLEETRVINMLNATDYALVRMGAKRVYYGHTTDNELVSLAQRRLSQEWASADGANDEQIDAIAWLIKAMAEASNKSAKPLLQQIAKQAKVGKLRKYADKYAEYL